MHWWRQLADTGWVTAGTGSNVDYMSFADWTTPGNVTSDDGSNASVYLDFLTTGSSDRLDGHNYGFSLPTGSTIDGFEARVGDYYVADGGLNDLDWAACDLRKSGADYELTSKYTELAKPATSAFTDEVGGPSDVWGYTEVTETDVEDSDFGFSIRVFISSGQDTMYVDFMQMKVYYTDATPTITDVNTTESWTDGDTGLVITGTNFV